MPCRVRSRTEALNLSVKKLSFKRFKDFCRVNSFTWKQTVCQPSVTHVNSSKETNEIAESPLLQRTYLQGTVKTRDYFLSLLRTTQYPGPHRTSPDAFAGPTLKRRTLEDREVPLDHSIFLPISIIRHHNISFFIIGELEVAKCS